jgi:hypothetical protein
MRKGLFAGTLALFVVWFAWKGVPFLTTERPATYATPTVQPTEPATLAPIAVKGGKTACTDNIPFGPDARYVQFTLVGGKYPASALSIVASAPGYRATARLPAGTPGNALQTVRLAPASRPVENGRLCLTNEGRRQVAFYGINPGRGSSPSTTVVDGKPIPQELSITLLTSPSQSLGARLGTVASHIAAFRPVTGWQVFLLGLLAVLGVPVAVAYALARAAAQDETAQDDAAQDDTGAPGDEPTAERDPSAG